MSKISRIMRKFTEPCLSVTEDPETKLWEPTTTHDRVILESYHKPTTYTIDELDDLLIWASSMGYWLETAFLDEA